LPILDSPPVPGVTDALLIGAPLPPLSAAFAWFTPRTQTTWQVALFRREFNVPTIPTSRRIVVTADSRYILSLNGRRLGRGPLKGTLARYHAETYELAPLLHTGRNVLAAEVRWWGEHGPVSEVHGPVPGFLVQEVAGHELNTPGQWLVCPDEAISPNWDDPFTYTRQFLGPLERVDARRRPPGWREVDFDATGWMPAQPVAELTHTQGWGVAPTHRLYPRPLPALKEESHRFDRLSLQREPGALPWSLAAGQSGEIWLDAGSLTTSYPELRFLGGAGRIVEIVYAEALGQWNDREGDTKWRKHGPRADLACGEPRGYRDALVLPGGEYGFEPFHWRTFRHLRVRIETGDSPVTFLAASHRFTTFPQAFAARFDCAESYTDALWRTSIRTLELCAHETYEDCPYFEQLCYTADARLQALCSHYLANDTRLGRQALRFFRDSLDASGLTASRVPARGRQVLPAFSLHWILMLGDHWRWLGRSDLPFVRESLPVLDAVLTYFRNRLTPDGFVGRIDEWAWIDWVPEWPEGVAPHVAAGHPSTFLTALFAMALETSLMLHNEAGLPADAFRWGRVLEEVRGAIRSSWSESAGYFQEGPDRTSGRFTQLTQAMAVLAGAANAAQLQRLGARLIDDPELLPMSLMHRFYLAQALARTGGFDRFFPQVLAPWRTMLANGLTTWQETSDPTRSDCHAWSSWPAIIFMTEILGVRPGTPGWTSIVVEPRFTATAWANGRLDTPAGRVEVKWSANAQSRQLELLVQAPAGVPVTVLLPGVAPRRFRDGGCISLHDISLPPLPASSPTSSPQT
jgi:alpha-L-rhamnosidase